MVCGNEGWAGKVQKCASLFIESAVTGQLTSGLFYCSLDWAEASLYSHSLVDSTSSPPEIKIEKGDLLDFVSESSLLHTKMHSMSINDPPQAVFTRCGAHNRSSLTIDKSHLA